MLRSLWSGVSGLKTHQLEMDVIGNNIANVNTTSYKSQATGFQDILYQTTKDSSPATENKGSINATQIGLGTRVGSILTNVTRQGSAVVTDNVMDLMITGDSFFVVEKDGVNNYSRDGSFTIDSEGYLVTQSNGYFVKGTQGTGGVTPNTTRIRVVNATTRVEEGGQVKMVDMMQGEPTKEANIKGILDSEDKRLSDEEGMDLNLEVYGTDGKRYNLKFKLDDADDEDSATFNLSLKSVTDEKGEYVKTSTPTLKLEFDKHNGDLKTVSQGNNKVNYKRDDKGVLKGDKALTLTFSDKAPLGNTTLDMTYLYNYQSRMGAKHISNVNAYKGNILGENKGYESGVLNGLSFGTDGSIYGSYTNGQTVKKGHIAVAEFSNAMGLEKIGENLYAESLNSGEAMVQDITKNGGYMSSGVLEGSNVDLAKEFTDMITTQRGFQANSKVITTSDEMLQILKGLKR